MASYKVPQDVEADDKLIGPFSFKQFIYLLIAAGATAASVFLAGVFIPLLIITAPVALFFLVLALPLRKDQTMEVYLTAVLQFYLKPREKVWDSDNIDDLVEFTNIVEEKDNISLRTLSAEQTVERLSFLSNVMDTGGWSIRGVSNSSLQDSVITEAEQTTDIQEDNNVLEAFDRMLSDSGNRHREDVLNGLKSVPRNQPYQNLQPYAYSQTRNQATVYNPGQNPRPAPDQPQIAQILHEQVRQAQQPSQPSNPTPITRESPQLIRQNIVPELQRQVPINHNNINSVNPDIMNLATNEDLSIEVIASEARRIEQERQAKDVLGGQDQLEIRLR